MTWHSVYTYTHIAFLSISDQTFSSIYICIHIYREMEKAIERQRVFLEHFRPSSMSSSLENIDSSIASFWLGWLVGSWPLFWALFVSFVLGTAYSIDLLWLR